MWVNDPFLSVVPTFSRQLSRPRDVFHRKNRGRSESVQDNARVERSMDALEGCLCRIESFETV
jgi:hypothetical protein